MQQKDKLRLGEVMTRRAAGQRKVWMHQYFILQKFMGRQEREFTKGGTYETEDGAASNILVEWSGAYRMCFGRLSNRQLQ